MQAVKPALQSLRAKLRKYYTLTDYSFVYPDAVILQPRGKLQLFQRKNWVDTDINKYSDLCRQRYLRDYQEARSMPPSPVRGKRSHAAMEDEDEAYEAFLNSLSTNTHLNEYDRYVSSPISEQRIPILQWWRHNGSQYPHISLMVRDTLAVPATGAGVEREFSCSGRVISALRHRLSPETVHEIVKYKNYLKRKQDELKMWREAENSIIAVEATQEIKACDADEELVLTEWRKGWWGKRRNQLRL